MDDTTLIALISALAIIFSGVITSIIAPKINWGIQKKKEKDEQRRKLLEANRNIILQEYKKIEKFNNDLALGNIKIFYPTAQNYLDTLYKYPEFHQLKPFLNKDTMKILEESQLLELKDRKSQLGQIPKPYQLTLDNITLIEKEWDLI
ncbi:MAG: hypothetical protein RDU14_04385 [Melioribacteraceae bacterium]|nr:hypothetical protein [Melioribacteraceae bacterium]